MGYRLPGVELGQFPELPVQLLDDHFGLHQVLVFQLAQWLPPRRGDQLFLLVVLHSHHVDLGLEVSLRLPLDSVGGVGEDPIVLIGADERVDSVFGLFEHGVLIVGVGLREGGVVGDVVFSHILPPELVEVGRVVVHLRGKLISQPYEFKNLAAGHASLERAFPEHQPQQLVGFVIVLVGGAGAADEAEGGVGGEDNSWIIDGSKVGELDSLKIVIGLQVEGVAAEVGLPFRGNLIKTLGCEVGLHAVLDTRGLEGGLDVLARGDHCFLEVAEGV